MKQFMDAMKITKSSEDLHEEEDFDLEKEINDHLNRATASIRYRIPIETVYHQLMDGILFDDAITNVSIDQGVPEDQLKTLVIDDYKKMRADGLLYDSRVGHILMKIIHPYI